MDYLISILTTVGIYTILALSLNMLMGFNGLLSMAHVAFFGIGAYAVAIGIATPEILQGHSWSAWLPYPGWQAGFGTGLMLGLEVTTLLALSVGAVMNRFGGEIYSIATLGIGIIAATFFLNATSVTQGPLGIAGVVPPSIAGVALDSSGSYMIFVWVCAALVGAACWGISRSPFGRILQCIREDELTIRLFGFYTPHFKLMNWVMSSWMATLAGGLFACHLQFVDPTSFITSETIFVITMVILGGLASHKGALLGAVIMVSLPEALRFVGAPPEYAAQLRQILFGLALVVLMVFRPQGILGKFKL